MKKRGSAIVIAVFLIAAIGGLAFSFGRLFLLESRNAVISENGISAYYAAESGIEEGFLRYRYDQNAEIPYGNGTNTYDWKVGDNKVFRSNIDRLLTYAGLSSGGDLVTKVIPFTEPNNYTNEQVYKLRMGFAGTLGLPIYGQDANNDRAFNEVDVNSSGYSDGKYDFLKIAKDETYKIDLSKMDLADPENDIKIMAKFPQSSNKAESIMYAKLTVDYTGNGSNIREYKTIMTSAASPVDTCSVLGRPTDPSCPGELTSTSSNTGSPNPIVWTRDNLISVFRSQFGAKTIDAPSKKVTLSLKPLFSNAYIGLVTKKCAVSLNNCPSATKKTAVPGPVTAISSTGYFGGTTRTISANIDRQSGTLYDLFDYVIYQK